MSVLSLAAFHFLAPTLALIQLGSSGGLLLPAQRDTTHSMTGAPFVWVEEAQLVASDGGLDDDFGRAVAIDGDAALIGAYKEDDGALDSGAAYVFARSGSSWIQQAKLKASDVDAEGRFGWSVSLDGDTALVGAPHADHFGIDCGAAYVFVRAGSTWSQQARLVVNDSVSDDHLGYSVALSGDTAVCGVPDRYSKDHGVVFVFVRSGSTWTQEARLQDSNGEDWDEFGYSVAIEGDTLLVGAWHDDDGLTNSGSVFVFTRSGTTWSEQAKLRSTPPGSYDEFGSAVSLSGESALIGTLTPPVAFVFTRTGSSWNQEDSLVPDDGGDHYWFGSSVSLGGDVALIGSQLDDMASYDHGSAFLFTRSGGSWGEPQHLIASDSAPFSYFGSGVSVSGERLLIGAFGGYGAGHSSGKAYVYTRTTTGVGYCFGDPGSGTPCPCNNDNDGSVPGSGCDNGVFASGAELTGSGVPSVSHDSVVLQTTGLEPNNTGLYFQADNAMNGGDGVAFGDGLRCAGGNLVRLQIRFCDAAGVSNTTIPIGTKGGVEPGDTRRYQCWYRNQSTPACGLGVNEFNLSNGFEVIWFP